ncbi:MAG: peptidoglycan DD-metalloendopeptidase family protein [Anaerolineae bacterium]|nr:peptidoglycan DD-metalloendopeptidase family protein [Anaerolineae bacterium]
MRSYSVYPYVPPGTAVIPSPAWPEEADEDAAFEYLEGEVWFDDDGYGAAEEWYTPPPPGMPTVILIGLVVVLVMIGTAVHLSGQANGEQIAYTPLTGSGSTASRLHVADPTAVTAPYDTYTITQGPHGQSYGHLAIDLAAGRGEPVKSPINGFVTDLYIDEYGNTTLVLENEAYTVIMLHGDYTVAIGDEVKAGQVVGGEGNNGYTMDYWGNLCYGRTQCGNHTHLNIYDKRIQANVNPLDLIP